MNRAYTYKDIANKNFATVDFEGVWLAHIGRPELSGSWFVFVRLRQGAYQHLGRGHAGEFSAGVGSCGDGGGGE